MFEREHHRRIAEVLWSLNGSLLEQHSCYFGGGTAVAMRYGEFRESVDIDFLISSLSGYRAIREMMTGPLGVNAIAQREITQVREIRADQYGIRTIVSVAEVPIKFEIVLEGRIDFEAPADSDRVCGLLSLATVDSVVEKLFANSDRGMDDSIFSRDLIDLAMMRPTAKVLRLAISKAELAYGQSIARDLSKAIDRLRSREDRLVQCLEALQISLPKALVWQRIRALRLRPERAVKG